MAKQRIVVKIGSSSLTNANGGLSMEKLSEHVEALALLKKKGHEVVLISSGAVAAGFTGLGYPTRPVTIAGKQAAAAVGQGLLMQGYIEKFKAHNIVTAQLLLTRSGFMNKEQYNNSYATLTELLKRDVLPIINENDSVAVEELTFGDNDMLSALVSGLIHADFLIILTDVNGIYDQNPNENPNAKKYNYLPEITDELLQAASASGSKMGTGGMRSKIEAAKTALSLGVNVFIGTGSGKEKLIDILAGKGDGTYIGNAKHSGINNVKQWIALHSNVAGTIEIDAGAVDALLNKGRSLLPAGVVRVEGNFVAGDVVEVVNHKGEVIGRGEVNYHAEELIKIKGLSTSEAKKILQNGEKEVIHRDHWIALKKEKVRK
ncbi:glutamate 5-kinase [Calidifontibacillus erzurumensis]|uniref:Glutamate 5-kinase n=1 Tax=Calidifontibacillus erzurumensis TaxID=2741433 RepID=A0A8J8GCK6_9BACI|nr:glutamate 5-kinase [Calidifontibacillus erzurumensis]NSL50666.1 glutamate 5-kinase [Calidifontibacillus erzurumensis]